MRFVVLGAGMMGRAVVYDLGRSAAAKDILVADFDRDRAKKVASQFGRGKARATFADVRDVMNLAKVLRGADVAINCAQYNWNVEVMRAALQARVHYVDLGGLYHVTRRQFSLDGAFRRARLLALIGMGGAPGITNVMARAAAEGMERVEKVDVYNASVDLQRYPGPPGYTFSIATILDELTMPPVTFERGRFREKPLLSDPERLRFRPPIGWVTLRNSLHSELGTLPMSFGSKGVREVHFKINYAPDLVNRVRDFAALGLTESERVAVDGTRVSPRALLVTLLNRRAPHLPARDVEALRVVVTGREKGRRVARASEAWAQYSVRPSLSAVARDTGFPAAIAAQMLARGEIQGVGVQAPENVVPPERFFQELEKRAIRVRRWKV
jgi:lysine 6-dehydrogenase